MLKEDDDGQYLIWDCFQANLLPSCSGKLEKMGSREFCGPVSKDGKIRKILMSYNPDSRLPGDL